MKQKNEIKKINVFTDGGSRGNPGESGIGVYVSDEDGDALAEIGKRIGIGTNNRAEYMAVLEALQWVLKNKKNLSSLSEINFFIDSNLVMSQLNGFFKVKSPEIRNMIFEVRSLEAAIGIKVTYSHVPREQNRKADRLVNLALDNEI